MSEGRQAAGPRIGARGWEHASWNVAFYPGDLPPEWRLTFYANAFRAVLIPAERLAVSAPDEVAQWAEDVDSGFAFFAELDPVGGDAALEGWLARLEPLGRLLAGLVLAPSAETLSAAWLSTLAARWPLTWLAMPGPGGAAVAGAPARQVWRPRQGGEGCVGLLDAAPRGPRELRAVIEEFRAASVGCPERLLCFPGTPTAWREMEQARIITSLLGG